MAGKNITILYSGGLDSLIMKKMAELWYPSANIRCVYYKHGADSEEQEIALLPEDVEIRELDWLGKCGSPVAKKDDPMGGAIYIPGRNLVFATLAACQDLPDEIWMGTLYDECNSSATDKNHTFRYDASNVLTYVLSPFIDKVTIRFPFVEQEMTKVDTVRWALKNGLTSADLGKTVSCWHFDSNEGKACGRCKQCLKRYLVMALNGITEINLLVNPIEHGRHFIDYYLNKQDPNLDEANVRAMIEQAAARNLIDIK